MDKNAATKRGIPYYQSALDALARKFAEVMNGANNGYMYNSEGNYVDNTGAAILDADGKPISYKTATDEQKAYVKDNGGIKLGGNLFSISSTGNDVEGITAGNISISKDWASGSITIQNSYVMANDGDSESKPHVGSSATHNIVHIMALMDSKYTYKPGEINESAIDADEKFFEGSFQDFLTGMQNTLGQDYKSTSTLLENYYSAATELNVSRDGVSGVDLNDEAMSMMQYQKSYSAACRMMTTVDEILDKLINGTGIVGR